MYCVVTNIKKSSKSTEIINLDICPLPGFWDTGDSLTLFLFKGIRVFSAFPPSFLGHPPKKIHKKKEKELRKEERGEGRCIPEILKEYFLQGRTRKVPCPIHEPFTVTQSPQPWAKDRVALLMHSDF